MSRLNYLDRAKLDLVNIATYVGRASGSGAVARRFVADLRRHCNHLAGLPGHMGRPRPELGSDMRSVAYGNYVIVFRYAGDVFEVVNVFEGHRDIDAHFHDPDT